MWLVAPLMSRLPSAIQGKVLKLAGHVLESGNNLFVSAKSKQEKDRNLKRSVSAPLRNTHHCQRSSTHLCFQLFPLCNFLFVSSSMYHAMFCICLSVRRYVEGKICQKCARCFV